MPREDPSLHSKKLDEEAGSEAGDGTVASSRGWGIVVELRSALCAAGVLPHWAGEFSSLWIKPNS